MESTQSEINDERRTAVLESLGRKEGDVMENENGEYVMVEKDLEEARSLYQNKFEDVRSFEKLYLSDVEIDY